MAVVVGAVVVFAVFCVHYELYNVMSINKLFISRELTHFNSVSTVELATELKTTCVGSKQTL